MQHYMPVNLKKSTCLPDHFCPPDGLLQLHQPLFVLIPLHQHSGHLHPGEPPPLRHCHVTVLHGRWKLEESSDILIWNRTFKRWKFTLLPFLHTNWTSATPQQQRVSLTSSPPSSLESRDAPRASALNLQPRSKKTHYLYFYSRLVNVCERIVESVAFVFHDAPGCLVPSSFHPS